MSAGLWNTTIRTTLESIRDDGVYQTFIGTGRKTEKFGKGDQGIQRLQNYGFSSNPPKGSKGIVTSQNDNPDQMMGSWFEHEEHRPKNLGAGEWKLYDMWGKYLHAMQTGWKAMLKELVAENTDYFSVRIGSGNGAPRVSGTSTWVKLKKGAHFLEINDTGIIVSIDPVVGFETDPTK